jgi:hypothetical protein
MDYSLIMIRIEQYLKFYQKAILDHDLAAAKTHAAVIVQLSEELLFVTRSMK